MPIYGAIALYLGHQVEVDAKIRQGGTGLASACPAVKPTAAGGVYPAPARSRTDQPFVSIRYQADNDLNQLIVSATYREEPSIDFQTAHRAQLDRLDDVAVLQRAASEGRMLVTTISEPCLGTSRRF